MSENQPQRPTAEQVKRVLQEAVLRSYPNPDRKGCQGVGILRKMAHKELPHEHPFWNEHVSHCSPCYREFLDLRNQALKGESTRNTKLLVAAVVGLLVAAGSLYVSFRERPTAPP